MEHEMTWQEKPYLVVQSSLNFRVHQAVFGLWWIRPTVIPVIERDTGFSDLYAYPAGHLMSFPNRVMERVKR